MFIWHNSCELKHSIFFPQVYNSDMQSQNQIFLKFLRQLHFTELGGSFDGSVLVNISTTYLRKRKPTVINLSYQWDVTECELGNNAFIIQWKLCCFSVTQSCPTLCDPMDCSMPGSPVLHYLLELAQTHVHWIDDAIQQSHTLSSPSPPAFNLSWHQGLFQWVSSLHQMAKVLELQYQPFQWIVWVDIL